MKAVDNLQTKKAFEESIDLLWFLSYEGKTGI